MLPTCSIYDRLFGPNQCLGRALDAPEHVEQDIVDQLCTGAGSAPENGTVLSVVPRMACTGFIGSCTNPHWGTVLVR